MMKWWIRPLAEADNTKTGPQAERELREMKDSFFGPAVLFPGCKTAVALVS